jgi:hypothetical protein
VLHYSILLRTNQVVFGRPDVLARGLAAREGVSTGLWMAFLIGAMFPSDYSPSCLGSGLPIHISAMANLYHLDDQLSIPHGVEDAVVTLP